jgi:hypothetical protein
MPSTRIDQKKEPLALRLPEAVVAILDRLAEVGVHGTNRTEVARYLIIRGIDELKRDGYLGRD